MTVLSPSRGVSKGSITPSRRSGESLGYSPNGSKIGFIFLVSSDTATDQHDRDDAKSGPALEESNTELKKKEEIQVESSIQNDSTEPPQAGVSEEAESPEEVALESSNKDDLSSSDSSASEASSTKPPSGNRVHSLSVECTEQLEEHFPVSELKVVEKDDGLSNNVSFESQNDAEDGKADDSDSNESDESEDESGSDDEDSDDDEEEEQVTSFAEKQSLLWLAAEHDRVDILKAILADDHEGLLHAGIPPLHVAVAFGSTNATQCLLRMGADPSVRPYGEKDELPDVPNRGRFQGVSAWELAFGSGDDDVSSSKSSSWLAWGTQTEEVGGDRKKPVQPVSMAPSKREGIRHAFTAEALRCIGADEVDRLKQLLNSGMPATIDIGGKNLHDWAMEMQAENCQALLRPDDSQNEQPKDEETASSAVLDRPAGNEEESLAHLANRLDELESLGKALSSSLDNLAEEVSVCHGLLIMGGGAAALASHVRSLKALQERHREELGRLLEAWENSEDELAYWVKELGEDEVLDVHKMVRRNSLSSKRRLSIPSSSPDEEQKQRRELLAQIAASENKVRKLRTSITDLSEEHTRDLEEVHRRGLSGGIKLVRGLREELRELEYELSEAKAGEAECRTKVNMIQARLNQKQKAQSQPAGPATAAIPPASTAESSMVTVDIASETTDRETATSEEWNVVAESPERKESMASEEEKTEPSVRAPMAEAATVQDRQERAAIEPTEPNKNSEKIARGESSAIAVRQSGNQGYFPVDLWQILMRIIGFGNGTNRPPPPPSSSNSVNVMIV